METELGGKTGVRAEQSSTADATALEAWQARAAVPQAAKSKALEVLAGDAPAATRALALAALAVARLATDEPAAALEAALEVRELLGDRPEVIGLTDVGTVVTEARLTALRAAHILDDVVGAVRWGRESLVLAQHYSLPALVARAHNDLAAVFGSREVIDLAIQHLQAGIAALETAGLPVAPSLLTNLGNVYLSTGRLDEALAWFGLGRHGYLKSNDRFGAALARSNEGRALTKLGRHDEAIAAIEEALVWFEELPNARYVTVTRSKLADAHAAEGDSVLAERLFLEALAALEEQRDGFEAEIRANYGAFLLAEARHEAALEELRRAAALFEAADKPIPAANLLRPMGAALADLGRHQEAYEYLTAYQQERERVDSDHSGQVLSMLLAKLESGLDDEHELHVVARRAVADANRALREQAERLENLSVTDDLTGLHNRRYFRTRLEEEELRARRHDHDLAVLLFDVDNFKRVNDIFSHTVGDAVLMRVGALLKSSVRASDVLARWGGEEFAVLMPGVSKSAALDAAERSRQWVAGHDWQQIGPELKVTVSAGVATLSEVDLSEWELAEPETRVAELVKLVDARLYAAKRAGRNRIGAE